MKYIMYEKEINELKRKIPIIFPSELVHIQVAKALKDLVGTSIIVGAGDFNLLTLECTGKSTTLGIGSKEGDSSIIKNYEYSHGLEGALNLF